MPMQREQACDNLYHMGADRVNNEIIEQLFTDLFDIKHNILRQMMNEDPKFSLSTRADRPSLAYTIFRLILP